MKILLKSIKFLASRRLAVYMLTVATLIAVLTQIPFFLQRGLDRVVFSSWWYNGLLLLLFLNTLVCSFYRLGEVSNNKVVKTPEEMEKYPNYQLINSTEAGHLMLFVKDHLSRRKYKIHDVRHNCFLAQKGNSYYWGSLFFHLSFLVMLIGLIFNNLLGFHGTMIIPEQQIASEDHGSYKTIKEGILFREQHAHFQMGLEKIDVAFDRGKSTASVMESRVWIMEGHRQLIASQTVKPNQPARYKGRRILLTGYGYSPYFTLEHRGKKIFQQHINLMTSVNKKGEIEYSDSFNIPNSQIKVEVQLYPHATIASDGKITNVSNNLELPAVKVKVAQRKDSLFNGIALMGQTMKLSNGMKLNFLGVKRYGWFDIDYQPGVYFIYGGFALCLVGLVIALFITPKKIWVSMEGNHVEVAGYSKRYRQLFREEYNSLIAYLTNEEAVKDEVTDE